MDSGFLLCAFSRYYNQVPFLFQSSPSPSSRGSRLQKINHFLLTRVSEQHSNPSSHEGSPVPERQNNDDDETVSSIEDSPGRLVIDHKETERNSSGLSTAARKKELIDQPLLHLEHVKVVENSSLLMEVEGGEIRKKVSPVRNRMNGHPHSVELQMFYKKMNGKRNLEPTVSELYTRHTSQLAGSAEASSSSSSPSPPHAKKVKVEVPDMWRDMKRRTSHVDISMVCYQPWLGLGIVIPLVICDTCTRGYMYIC